MAPTPADKCLPVQNNDLAESKGDQVMKMKIATCLILAASVLTVTVNANEQQPSEKSIEAAKTSMQQAGRDGRKAAQQAKDAIGLALKAAESAGNEASKQATEIAQQLASDAEAAAKRAEDKVIAANKAAAAAGNEVAQKAEEAANKAVAATKEAAQKAAAEAVTNATRAANDAARETWEKGTSKSPSRS